jgi:serine/threonine protein kinase
VLGKVGRGTYGIVYKVVHKRTRQILAIKKIIDAFQNLIDAKRTYRELNYLLQLDHPAVVRLHNILLNGRRGAPQQPSTTRLAPQLHEIRGCNTDKLAHKPSPLHRHVYAVFELVETDLRMALKRCS